MTAALLLGVAALVSPRRRPRIALGARRPAPVTPSALLVLGCAAGSAAVSAGPAVGAAAALAAVTLGVRRRRRARRAAARREGQDLTAAMEVLVGELRIGSHPVRGFAVAAAEATGPVAAAFAAVAARARLGADVATGLRITARTSAVPLYWSHIAVCWQLASELGLPMADLMQAAHRDILGRHRFADRVHASLAGARATAGVLAGLPALGAVLGHLVGARPLAFLLSDGAWLLPVGIALLCAGITWSDRIIDRVAP